MLKTALSLFAKKTAIVAITGTVVLGGGGLALAAVGEVIAEDGPEVAACETTDDTVTDDTVTDDCPVEDVSDTVETDEVVEDDATETDEVVEDAEDESATDVETDDEADVYKNHGEAVSTHVHEVCHELEGRERGECASEMATSDEGKKDKTEDDDELEVEADEDEVESDGDDAEVETDEDDETDETDEDDEDDEAKGKSGERGKKSKR